MAKTAQMSLMELMVLKEDISNVLLYLGKSGNFQFQSSLGNGSDAAKSDSAEDEMYKRLENARSFLGIDDSAVTLDGANLPEQEDFNAAQSILQSLEDLNGRDAKAREECKRAQDAYSEAASFSNLKHSYSELEHLSFLNLRVGKIDPSVLDELKFALGTQPVKR